VGIGSAAASSPLAVRAQQVDRLHRIGVLMNGTADDPLSAIDRVLRGERPSELPVVQSAKFEPYRQN
jgi:hypothetical protein